MVCVSSSNDEAFCNGPLGAASLLQAILWPAIASSLTNIVRSLFHFYTDSKTQRTHGRQAQLGNIHAARAVADIIRSTLGPRSMLKMLLDPMVRDNCSILHSEYN